MKESKSFPVINYMNTPLNPPLGGFPLRFPWVWLESVAANKEHLLVWTRQVARRPPLRSLSPINAAWGEARTLTRESWNLPSDPLVNSCFIWKQDVWALAVSKAHSSYNILWVPEIVIKESLCLQSPGLRLMKRKESSSHNSYLLKVEKTRHIREY